MEIHEMIDEELNEQREMTCRLLAVIEAMKGLDIARLTLTAEGKVQTETVSQRTYFISANIDDPCSE
jgi:hypothetical protein